MIYFLVGFMGAGKTKVGQSLSKTLNLKFIDLDKTIEKGENRSINNIFSTDGDLYFRELEEKYLSEIIIEDNILVSTGGGTATYHNLMEKMNEAGTTIYLKCCTKTLYNRLLANKKNRPLINKLSSKNLRSYIENKLSERSFYYKKAHHTIDNDNGLCIDKIIKILG